MVFKPIVVAVARNGIRFFPTSIRSKQAKSFCMSSMRAAGDPCAKDPCGKKDDKGKKEESGPKKDGGKKEEPPPKKDDGKKEDPCKKEEDPCKKKEDPCKKEEDSSKKKEDPCKKEEDPCKKEEDPCKKKEDPCKKEEDPCEKKNGDNGKKEDPCEKKNGDNGKKEDPCEKKNGDNGKKDAAGGDKPCPEGACDLLKDPCPKTPDPCAKTEGKKKEPEEEVVILSMGGGKGVIKLNRPNQLNTLNTEMVSKIKDTLINWKEDKYLIYLKGEGEKAFCAGGDVVAITKDQCGDTGKIFFKQEYKMDALIASLKVPFASLMSGIVMGGGVGISIFGKYRIATETSMFAMPETQIGFFPDVGVSHRLARMPNELGTFLALTGYRLKGYDLIHAGIATHFIKSADTKALEEALLCDFERSLSSSPEEIFNEFQAKALKDGNPPPFSLAQHSDAIKNWFTAGCLEEAMGKLCKDDSPFAKETLECIKKMSPLSLKLTYRQLMEAKNKDIYECFNTDYRIALRMLEKGDFVEGVRALLIDKDKKPKWKHEELCQVTDEELDAFFCALPEDELDLPNTMCDPC